MFFANIVTLVGCLVGVLAENNRENQNCSHPQMDNVMLQVRNQHHKKVAGNFSSNENAFDIAKILASVKELKAFASNPSEALHSEDTKKKIIEVLVPLIKQQVGGEAVFKTIQQLTGKDPAEFSGQLVVDALECRSKKTCGNCTNDLKNCYWCPSTKSCHPVGSQQLHLDMSSAKCKKDNCLSQWPSSSCTSGYCPDGSSVGREDGPCSVRMTCEACSKAQCFWCGISGSCHTLGSRFYDKRCTDANCQSSSMWSSCDSKDCSKATKYEPK